MTIKLMQGDCLEMMKEMEGGSVDMVLADPPYGTTACKWDSVIPLEPMWEQLKRVIKPNGAIVLFGSEPFTSTLIVSNIKHFKYRWTWNKIKASNHLNSRGQPLRCIEDIAVFYKKQPVYNPQLRDRLKKNIRDPKREYGKGNNNTYGDTKSDFMFNSGREIPLEKGYPLDLIEMSQVGSFGNKRKHPTQKPVTLMEYMIKTYTNENETVLDFTMGSGSTGCAAKNLNRNFIGIELDEQYFKIAQERINNGTN